MRTAIFCLIALLAAGGARAQSSSVTAGGGAVSGSVSAPGLPPMSVQAGDGQVRTPPAPNAGVAETTPRGAGRSVTVRSPGGSAAAGAWTSEPGSVAVSGSGSPGSTIEYGDAAPGRSAGKAQAPPHKVRKHR